jgi:hypothetical protein
MRWACLLVGACLATGCSDDAVGLLLTIDVDGLSVGSDIDFIEVRMVASQDRDTSEAATTSEIVRETVPGSLMPTLSFPIDIAIRPGDQDWECVALDVVASSSDVVVLRDEGLYCTGLEGFAHETIVLERACHASYGAALCTEEQVCDGGSCVGSRVGALFDTD